MFFHSPFLCALLSAAASLCAASLPGATKTFGCIHSEPFLVSETEFTICDYNASTPGAITHLQFTFSTPSTGTLMFRAYIDSEPLPSIDVPMEQGMFGINSPASPDPTAKSMAAPWGNARIGRGSDLGGRYFNFRIPFTTRVRLTVYSSAPNAAGTSVFTIIRGAEGAAATAGGLTLPPTARLRVQTVFGDQVPKYAQLLALNTTGTSGILAMWILFVYDSNMGLTYLEGCQRAWLDGRLVQIGDGEDFFDSGYYYDAGMYVFPQAGLLLKGASSTLSYRIFDSDPIVWQAAANITWRNCETYPKCVDGGFSPPPDPSSWAATTSFMWYYTY